MPQAPCVYGSCNPARFTQLEELETEYEGLQAEQLIEMVKDELHLIPNYASAYLYPQRCLCYPALAHRFAGWKAWEAPEPTWDDESVANLTDELKVVNPGKADASGEADVVQPAAAWQMAVETVGDAQARAAAAAKGDEEGR